MDDDGDVEDYWEMKDNGKVVDAQKTGEVEYKPLALLKPPEEANDNPTMTGPHILRETQYRQTYIQKLLVISQMIYSSHRYVFVEGWAQHTSRSEGMGTSIKAEFGVGPCLFLNFRKSAQNS
jgi:hypothetical protein